MAFTPVSLTTQQLLETTFISDMRLIQNSNISVLKTKLEELINTLQIDLTNKYIGVDNYVNQVKTNNIILGNGITFMESTSVIASLAKDTLDPTKSVLTIDNLIIKPGGSIDMYGSPGNTMSLAITRLGVGIPLSLITANGLYVGDVTLPVKSAFYGETTFKKQAITQSLRDSTITTLKSGTDYYGYIKLTKSSSQFICVTISAPVGETPTSANQLTLFVYEDPADAPDPGQTFTISVKDYQTSTGTPVAMADWGDIIIAPGYTQIVNGTPVLINGGAIGVATTASAALSALSTNNYIKLFNSTIQTSTLIKKFAASVSLSKYESLTSEARFIITNSNNIELIN